MPAQYSPGLHAGGNLRIQHSDNAKSGVLQGYALALSGRVLALSGCVLALSGCVLVLSGWCLWCKSSVGLDIIAFAR